MSEIDLDSARAAREETQGERTFIFKGERFELPAELPYEVLEPIGRLSMNDRDLGALAATMRALMGEQAHERFVALRPSIADLNYLVGELLHEYGLASAPAAGGNGDGGGGGLDPKSPPSSPE